MGIYIFNIFLLHDAKDKGSPKREHTQIYTHKHWGETTIPMSGNSVKTSLLQFIKMIAKIQPKHELHFVT